MEWFLIWINLAQLVRGVMIRKHKKRKRRRPTKKECQLIQDCIKKKTKHFEELFNGKYKRLLSGKKLARFTKKRKSTYKYQISGLCAKSTVKNYRKYRHFSCFKQKLRQGRSRPHIKKTKNTTDNVYVAVLTTTIPWKISSLDLNETGSVSQSPIILTTSQLSNIQIPQSGYSPVTLISSLVGTTVFILTVVLFVYCWTSKYRKCSRNSRKSPQVCRSIQNENSPYDEISETYDNSSGVASDFSPKNFTKNFCNPPITTLDIDVSTNTNLRQPPDNPLEPVCKISKSTPAQQSDLLYEHKSKSSDYTKKSSNHESFDWSLNLNSTEYEKDSVFDEEHLSSAENDSFEPVCKISELAPILDSNLMYEHKCKSSDSPNKDSDTENIVLSLNTSSNESEQDSVHAKKSLLDVEEYENIPDLLHDDNFHLEALDESVFQKESTIASQNLFETYQKDMSVQTTVMNIPKTILDTDWEIDAVFGSQGGTLQTNNSSVKLIVPKGTVSDAETFQIYGKIHTEIGLLKSKLSLDGDKHVLSAAPEYHMTADWQKVVKRHMIIALPFSLPPKVEPKDIIVYTFDSTDGKIQKRRVKEKTKENTDLDMFYELDLENNIVQVFTRHFSGVIICHECSKPMSCPGFLIARAFGIYQKLPTEEHVQIRYELWDKKLQLEDFQKAKEAVTNGKRMAVLEDKRITLPEDINKQTHLQIALSVRGNETTPWESIKSNDGTDAFEMKRDIPVPEVVTCCVDIPYTISWILKRPVNRLGPRPFEALITVTDNISSRTLNEPYWIKMEPVADYYQSHKEELSQEQVLMDSPYRHHEVRGSDNYEAMRGIPEVSRSSTLDCGPKAMEPSPWMRAEERVPAEISDEEETAVKQLVTTI